MRCNLLIGLTIFFACLFASANADAARTSRLQVAEADFEYRNKPVAADATVWYCMYDGKQSISCRLGDPGKAIQNVKIQADPRLPALAHSIRNQPELLASTQISIPLHTVPFDFEMVGLLAESVMCGSRNACAVIFARNLVSLEPLVRTFEQQRLARSDQATIGPIAAAFEATATTR